ncbi:pyridoxal 5'-phosphate synthase [Streptomyces sp. NPDC047002]|uniref:pyridoxine/pyridoxamine 5'-phosphate oxidase n=1 Tax=Streptomyces sp. NPDC047002 TaxID=3155475 RepID=UPI00345182D5
MDHHAGLRELLRGIEVFAGDDLPTFDPADTPAAPEELFVTWLRGALAAGVREPHAMTLSTVDAEGHPDARVLILKNLENTDAGGWQFAVHAGSPKGREPAAHPRAALTFYWPPLARQGRVRGPVAARPAQQAAADFLARSPQARAEALLGTQSRPLGDLAERDRRTAESLARVERHQDLVAPEWTLYELRAERVEFWQGDAGRRHTRLAYLRAADGWRRQLLWP